MCTVELLQMSSVVVTLVLLASAAFSDLRTREVSDWHWVVAVFVGMSINLACGVLDDGCRWEFLANLVSGTLFVITIFLDLGKYEKVLWSVSLAMCFAVLLFGTRDCITTSGAVSVLYCFVYLVMYWTGVLRGGADAKCLMAMSLAIPLYPASGCLAGFSVPAVISIIFAPSISAMFLASVMSVVGCVVYCIWRNAGQIPEIHGFYRGYMMPVVSVEKSFVWPAEDLVDGVRTRCMIADDADTEGVCRKFKEAGIEEIYVTPMVPFVVPITVAAAIVVFIGNPLFIL